MIDKNTDFYPQLIQDLLEDVNLEVHLSSSISDFIIIYSTNPVPDVISNPTIFFKTKMVINGASKCVTVIDSPQQQAENVNLVVNLLKFSDYRVFRVVKGWRLVCSKCNAISEGKIWRISPDICSATHNGIICGHKFTELDKTKVEN
ncbi:hypothetical protein POAN111098_09070 [Polynucleobacter antarcticus]|uniref:Uncharacterized protein n=1 Tax=Polynucleobacter antarcticus TaxID=1743162 RepID=A0A6M9PH30_9BURK|nr:hypothetical protein DCO16_03085 [Polynucleobacter antarcticus]